MTAQNVAKRSFSWAFSAGTALIILFSVSGCSSIDNNDKTIADLVNHFDASGLKVEKIQPTAFDVIKAKEGCGLFVDNTMFEVYKYDRTVPVQKKKIEKIVEVGEINILGFDFPVKVNGSFILLNYKKHPRKREIIEAFRKFQ